MKKLVKCHVYEFLTHPGLHHTEKELCIAKKAAELNEKHPQEFIKRAFSVRALGTYIPLTTASAMIKMCRPPKDLDYISYILKNWQVGVIIKTMDPSSERDRISKFRHANHNGAKFVKQYVLEEIVLPGPGTYRTVLRRWEKALLAGLLCPESRCFTA